MNDEVFFTLQMSPSTLITLFSVFECHLWNFPFCFVVVVYPVIARRKKENEQVSERLMGKSNRRMWLVEIFKKLTFQTFLFLSFFLFLIIQFLYHCKRWDPSCCLFFIFIFSFFFLAVLGFTLFGIHFETKKMTKTKAENNMHISAS